MLDSNGGTFFKVWIQNPKQTGALSASSQTLTSEIAQLVDHDGSGTIIELGGGTGAITDALLQKGVSPGRLIVIEKNPYMADALLRRFPNVCTIQQDASRLGQIVHSEQATQINTIISRLPMLLLGKRKQYAILRQAFNLLEPSGSFLQFTYGPFTPVCRQILDRLGIKGERASYVWRNAPPAIVWRFSRNNLAV